MARFLSSLGLRNARAPHECGGKTLAQACYGFAVIALLIAAPAHAEPQVVASTKALHSLVSMVMQGVGQPKVLLSGNTSPHTLQFRPSQALTLKNAEVIFYTGPQIDRFMGRALQTVQMGATVVDVSQGMTLLSARDSDGDHGGTDIHLWLDAKNGIAAMNTITEALVKRYPKQERQFKENATRAKAALESLQSQMGEMLKPVAGKPFMATHDGTQYLERAYGLTYAGLLGAGHEQPVSAQRLRDRQEQMRTAKITCVLAEPGQEETAARYTKGIEKVRITALDLDGTALTAGQEYYEQLLLGAAKAIAECVNAGGSQ